MNTTYKIQNLKCDGCANTIQSQLEKVHGIEAVTVRVETNELEVVHEQENTLIGVIETLRRLGYPLAEEKNTFQSKARSYVSCAVGRL